jgi:hypothetical protein
MAYINVFVLKIGLAIPRSINPIPDLIGSYSRNYSRIWRSNPQTTVFNLMSIRHSTGTPFSRLSNPTVDPAMGSDVIPSHGILRDFIVLHKIRSVSLRIRWDSTIGLMDLGLCEWPHDSCVKNVWGTNSICYNVKINFYEFGYVCLYDNGKKYGYDYPRGIWFEIFEIVSNIFFLS